MTKRGVHAPAHPRCLLQYRFYASYAGGGGLLFDNAKMSEFARAGGVRTAADLFGEFAHSVHFDFFAVLRREQTDRALRFGFVDGHFLANYGDIGGNRFVDELFNRPHFFVRHGASERKVEPQAFFGDVRAFLVDVLVV